MIPGRRYGFDGYLRMAWRRKWLIAASFVLVNMTAAVVASTFVPPQTYEIYSTGLIGGLVVALALVVFLERRDTTFRTDDDVVLSLSLPVLAVVPAMLSARERLSRRRRRLLALSFAAALVASGALITWVTFK